MGSRKLSDELEEMIFQLFMCHEFNGFKILGDVIHAEVA